MSSVELWTLRVPIPTRSEAEAERVEAQGWDGMVLTDSQNLAGDPYLALALAARVTHRLGLGTGVTNPVTRHPAVTATAIASVQEISGGRAVLGIGRGDSALFHLGREPAPVAVLHRYLERLQGYLSGAEVDLEGHTSRLLWLSQSRQPKVPVDVAATGPRVTALAARLAERVTFAVGADPERLRRSIDAARSTRSAAGLDANGVSFGAYVNVVPHPDPTVARNIARGGIGSFAHFSGMTASAAAGARPEDRAVFERIHRGYDRARHTMSSAAHAAALEDAFLDRFGVIGPPAHCVARLRELVAAGVERLVIIAGSRDADREEVRRSSRLFVEEVMPALRA